MAHNLSSSQESLLLFLYTPTHKFARTGEWRYNIPIIGKTRFMKLMFLLDQESEIWDYLVHPYEFDPYRYGPHSFKMEEDLDELILMKLIAHSEPIIENKPIHYWLSNEGKIIAGEIWSTLSSDIKNAMYKIKKRYNSWPLKKLLYYVYSAYPGWTFESEIRGEIIDSER